MTDQEAIENIERIISRCDEIGSRCEAIKSVMRFPVPVYGDSDINPMLREVRGLVDGLAQFRPPRPLCRSEWALKLRRLPNLLADTVPVSEEPGGLVFIDETTRRNAERELRETIERLQAYRDVLLAGPEPAGGRANPGARGTAGKKRGRRPVNPEFDRRVAQIREADPDQPYDETARELNATSREVKKAIDRNRKRNKPRA